MRLLAIVLIIAGLFGLVAGGITYTKKEKVLDIGPIEATATQKERVPISPIAGGAALVAGIALLMASRRGRSAIA